MNQSRIEPFPAAQLQITRREALLWAGAATGLFGGAAPVLRAAPGVGIESIEPCGVLIRECTLPGEGRADDVVPAHPNGIPVSRNRWLLVYATRGFRGVDDDLSIIYQIRAGAPDGRLIKEGFLARTQNDWDPLGDGNTRHVKQHGHPVAFGVPQGALIGGKPAPSANVFVVKWRKVARDYDPVRKYLTAAPLSAADLELRTQDVEWMQFRLNDSEDDIEILQPPRPLRQKGYETGGGICRAPVRTINESYVQAVPFNRDCTEWADCCYFLGADVNRSSIAAMRYAFDAKSGRYEWVEVGPLLGPARNTPVIPASGGKKGMMEPSLVRWRGEWVIAARGGPGGGATWLRTNDLFGKEAPRFNPDTPEVSAPLTAYAWPDGQLRLLTGDARLTPYKNSGSPGRDPLYCWEIDPDRGFRASNCRVIFDTFKAGLPFRPESGPKVDMAKLLPGQGRTQLIAYRVTMRAHSHPYYSLGGAEPTIPLANKAEKAACAIYYSKVTYSGELPSRWEFGA